VSRITEGETMRSKCISKFFLAALFLAFALPLSAQSNPAGVEGGWPLIVGGGLSRFNVNYPFVSSSYMEGPTVWADWTRIPFMPKPLGVEAELRRIDLSAPSAASQLRISTFQGGPTYTVSFSRLAVYGKGFGGYGSINFPASGSYRQDSRTIYGLGGGAEYRCWNSVWVRGDYEYQWWPNLFISGGMKPNGFTFGLAYDLRTVHRSY
jgi:opacity protein-like surface antigen